IRKRSAFAGHNLIEDKIKGTTDKEWLFEGPCVYYLRKEVKMLKTETAQKIEPTSALCLRALKDYFDRSGLPRVYGEQWLVKKPGAYLPGPYEEVVEKRTAYKLPDKSTLKIRTLQNRMDGIGKKCRFGKEWLSTLGDTYMLQLVRANAGGVFRITTTLAYYGGKKCPQFQAELQTHTPIEQSECEEYPSFVV
ncbi:major Vault Protein repeat-containing domain protein, partial [Opisthorchis viverrini]